MSFSRAISRARLVSMPISFAASMTVLPASASAFNRGLLIAPDPQLVAVGGAEHGGLFTADAGGDFFHRPALAEVLIQLLVQVRDETVSSAD